MPKFHSRIRGMRRTGPVVRTTPMGWLGSANGIVGEKPADINWLAEGTWATLKVRDANASCGGSRAKAPKHFPQPGFKIAEVAAITGVLCDDRAQPMRGC